MFAYGATGAGKTFSMMGNERDPGVIPRSMCDLFDLIEISPNPASYTITLSYMEVYCETIRDLLSESERSLNPCEHASDGTVRVLGLTERVVDNVDEVLDLVREGNARRKTEPTAANEVSSRSHAVLQVTCKQALSVTASATLKKSMMGTKTSGRTSTTSRVNLAPRSSRASLASSNNLSNRRVQEPVPVRESRLSLIDLAGSERAANTLNTGTRLREGANINKSLLALANCINALSTKNERVKYRDSKLTHLLKSSLEGDCRVAMIAAVTPSHRSYEESHNTLKYAYRAKHIKAAIPTQMSTALTTMAAAAATTPTRMTLSSVDENAPPPMMSDLKKSVVKPSVVHFNHASATSQAIVATAAPPRFEYPLENRVPRTSNSTQSFSQDVNKLEHTVRMLEFERNSLAAKLDQALEQIALLQRAQRQGGLMPITKPAIAKRTTMNRSRALSVMNY